MDESQLLYATDPNAIFGEAFLMDDDDVISTEANYYVTAADHYVTAASRSVSSANGSASSGGVSPLRYMRLVCEVYISLPLGTAGLVGSILSFIVLCHQRPRLTSTVVLQYLALADALNLAMSIPVRSLRYIDPPIPYYTEELYPYIFCFLYPLMFVVRLAQTWLVVLLTVDRYIAVCHPLKASQVCTVKKTKIQVVVIFVASLVFSLPRTVEYYPNKDDVISGGFTKTWLMKDTTYVVLYRILLFFFAMYLIPMLTVSILNTVLLVRLKRSLVARSSLHHVTSASVSNPGGGGGGSVSAKLVAVDRSAVSVHSRVTLITIVIVVMSITCDVVAMSAHALYSLGTCFPSTLGYLIDPSRYVSNVSNTLVTLNSSIHFVVYCAFSSQFRRVLCRMLRCQKDGRYVGASDAYRSNMSTGAPGVGGAYGRKISQSGQSPGSVRALKVTL